jgi:hypothetical protein
MSIALEKKVDYDEIQNIRYLGIDHPIGKL